MTHGSRFEYCPYCGTKLEEERAHLNANFAIYCPKCEGYFLKKLTLVPLKIGDISTIEMSQRKEMEKLKRQQKAKRTTLDDL